MRTRSLATLAVVSLMVVVGVPLAWGLGGSSTPAGIPQPAAPLPAPSGPAVATAPAVPVRPATPGPVTDPSPPVRVVVAGAGIDAPVRAVGIGADGQVEVPADARQVGWYRFGPEPGSEAGSAVLVGHRDSRTQGAGALFPLDRARPGDRVTVTLADATVVTYQVTERRWYDKQALPLASLFDRSGPARLTLVTCGGAYDPERGGYQQNLVVTAVPVGAP